LRADERHETTTAEETRFEFSILLDVEVKSLVVRVGGLDGNDESPALSKLFDEVGGDFGAGGGDEDSIEGGFFEPAKRAVAHTVMDIMKAKLGV
jgi:hypothetical protein